MKSGKKPKKDYKCPDLLRLPLELEGALMECSVRVNANDLAVEPYHDYFYETGEVSAEGAPFEIRFGE